jgi:maleylpyruvate isomerase
MVRFVDRATDPGVLEDLALARLGQAYFSRKLNELDDLELAAPSSLPGWTRAHVIAHVGYNARAIARLVEWAETGVEHPMYASREARDYEIDFGATLSARALRHLSDHAAVQLDVAWRDLPDERWGFTVRSALGREIPASETVWMRSRELWLHALDLGNGARARDIPVAVQRRLLRNVLGTWASRDGLRLSLRATDTGERFETPGLDSGPDASPGASGDDPPLRAEGALADLVSWATGRGGRAVDAVDADGRVLGPAPEPHRWI